MSSQERKKASRRDRILRPKRMSRAGTPGFIGKFDHCRSGDPQITPRCPAPSGILRKRRVTLHSRHKKHPLNNKKTRPRIETGRMPGLKNRKSRIRTSFPKSTLFTEPDAHVYSFSYIGIEPKNGHKDSFDPHTRGAMTSGPFKDGFLQTFHATSTLHASMWFSI